MITLAAIAALGSLTHLQLVHDGDNPAEINCENIFAWENHWILTKFLLQIILLSHFQNK